MGRLPAAHSPGPLSVAGTESPDRSNPIADLDSQSTVQSVRVGEAEAAGTLRKSTGNASEQPMSPFYTVQDSSLGNGTTYGGGIFQLN